MKIPKIIHYVWVGNSPKSELVLKCIASWKQHCPDYEIMEWNDESLANIENNYVTEAYKAKKWAFVSDYLRLYALEKHGGVYCDSDLEITQNIDEFLTNDFFTGYERIEQHDWPITALMGSAKNNRIVKDLLSEYKSIHFVVDGVMDMTTNTSRISKYFANNFDLKEPYSGDQISPLGEIGAIYPSHYFCKPESGKNNYSIHHFSGSWIDPYRRKERFSLLGFSIVVMKKNKGASSNELPFEDGEKIIWGFSRNKRKKVFLVKNSKPALSD